MANKGPFMRRKYARLLCSREAMHEPSSSHVGKRFGIRDAVLDGLASNQKQTIQDGLDIINHVADGELCL